MGLLCPGAHLIGTEIGRERGGRLISLTCSKVHFWFKKESAMHTAIVCGRQCGLWDGLQ